VGPNENQPKPVAFHALSRQDAPIWSRPLLECLERSKNDPASRYGTLATVDRDLKPKARTVVIRGCFADFNHPDYQDVISDSWDFWMITDARSAKLEELHHQPSAEICWYFGVSRIQFRISGDISIYRQENCPIRQKAWDIISDTAKVQFYWPEPKQVRDGYHQNEFELSDLSATPPENFVVLSLGVENVDQLNLNGNPQNRYLYQNMECGSWSRDEVNP
jgi:PPOX class probable FMN-dependent enzyme